MQASRRMALTPELVAQVHRALDDPGPDPSWTYHGDEDYDAVVQALMRSHPGGPDTWLFAYGSLIWKPEVEHVEMRKGTARGWHRSFCFRIVRFRGTKEQPGLMMSLDRGGQCQGVLLRLASENLEAQLGKLVRREMTVKPPNNLPRWISVGTGSGPVRALAFVMNRKSRFYVGKLSTEEVADTLAKACGHWGSCAEYLHNTVAHLEEHGIHDRGLWKLQELVAGRIDRMGQCRPADTFHGGSDRPRSPS
jgi:glutathione-specific gamma-glutamylcyclotransferase